MAELAKAKKALYDSVIDESNLVQLAENVLPHMFKTYEMSQGTLNLRALQIISKLIAIFSKEIIKGFIQPKECARFIKTVLNNA